MTIECPCHSILRRVSQEEITAKDFLFPVLQKTGLPGLHAGLEDNAAKWRYGDMTILLF